MVGLIEWEEEARRKWCDGQEKNGVHEYKERTYLENERPIFAIITNFFARVLGSKYLCCRALMAKIFLKKAVTCSKCGYIDLGSSDLIGRMVNRKCLACGKEITTT